jgi:hypothetical protein
VREGNCATESTGSREVDHALLQPFTFDLPELDELIKIAKEKKLFLMEAVWTRFVRHLRPEIVFIADISSACAAPYRL